MGKKVYIIGSGLAGLATALRLSKRGYDVEIIEKNGKAGGRLNQISFNGFTFDIGPSFFTMTYEFDEFANDCSIKLPFEYTGVDPLFSVNFLEDKSTYSMYRDADKLDQQFCDIEPNFKSKMQKYLSYEGSLFNDTIDIAVRQNFDSMFDYIKSLVKINKKHIPLLFTNYQSQINKYFSSPELRKILSLSAYFLGNTPRMTNGVYTLLSYAEFVNDGYYSVNGGMYKIVEGLINELNKSGVNINYNSEIENVKRSDKKIKAVIDRRGRCYEGDYFVSNIDPLLFKNKILHKRRYIDKYLESKNWSMGMLTIYVGLDIKLGESALHNYFIGKDDYKNQMNNFTEHSIPNLPYYYVNIQSKYNKTAAPDGCEALMFVVPVPNLIYKKDWSDKEDIANKVIKDFSNRIGINIKSHIKAIKVLTPFDWEKKFNLYGGAALGLSHSMSQTGFLRPSNTDKEFNNLFYTGSSTLPGIGLPMTIISSRLTTERIIGEKIIPDYTKK